MAAAEDGRFGYFVVQARADAGWSGAATVRGVIENLATGERWAFESAAEMAALVVAWGHPSRPTSAPSRHP